jgi:hypothetical protein
LKILCNELSPPIRDKYWPMTGKPIQRSLNHQLDVLFLHSCPYLVMNDKSLVPIDDGH